MFALFRAQGRHLGRSVALGGIVAQPYLEGTAIAPGSIVAAIKRSSPRRGPVWVVVGDPAGRPLLFADGDHAFLVEAEAVELAPIDIPGRVDAYEVRGDLEPRQAFATNDLDRVQRRSVQLGRIAAAAEIHGAAERAVDLAVEHARHREQFGAPIGTFQAVRHLLAWARTDCVAISATVRKALLTIDDAPVRYDEVVKALAGRNGRRACQRSLQVLGAIGFTAEHTHHHHYSPRAPARRPPRHLGRAEPAARGVAADDGRRSWLRHGVHRPRQLTPGVTAGARARRRRGCGSASVHPPFGAHRDTGR